VRFVLLTEMLFVVNMCIYATVITEFIVMLTDTYSLAISCSMLFVSNAAFINNLIISVLHDATIHLYLYIGYRTGDTSVSLVPTI